MSSNAIQQCPGPAPSPGAGAQRDPVLPGLRLVKVPDTAPPYDGQGHGTRGPERPADVPSADVACPAVRPAAGTRALGPPSAAGPAAAGPAAALALVIAETLAGVRPERQLIPLTTDRVRAHIRGLGPLLRCDQRPRVLRILASRPVPGVVEMTMVVTFGPRSRALALRFEHTAGRTAAPGWPARPARWLCTAIETG
jgi:hypothetical protein